MNILNKITTYLKEVRMELAKVNWPTRRQTLKYTLIVIGASLATAVFLGGIDFLFSYLLDKLIV